MHPTIMPANSAFEVPLWPPLKLHPPIAEVDSQGAMVMVVERSYDAAGDIDT